jgi:hypothetical protein
MYEVEFKIEITSEQESLVVTELTNRSFVSEEVFPINDFFIEAKKSEHGGYDLKRYRQEGNAYIFTEKTWEKKDGMLARKEDEYEVSKEQFESVIAQHPEAIKIIKNRKEFHGNFEEKDITVAIDHVHFDHSPNTRFFIEGEILVPAIEEVEASRAFIKRFLLDLLGLDDVIESPGMFTMAMKKI